MTKLEMEVLVNELLVQDIELKKIYKRREEIAEMAKNADCYDKMWEMLYADGESHCEF